MYYGGFEEFSRGGEFLGADFCIGTLSGIIAKRGIKSDRSVLTRKINWTLCDVIIARSWVRKVEII